jgi:hypothetical protein
MGTVDANPELILLFRPIHTTNCSKMYVLQENELKLTSRAKAYMYLNEWLARKTWNNAC